MNNTPGPWHHEAKRIWREGDFPEPVAYVESEGDAFLLAASPDLLQSLRELLEICRWKCSPNDEVLLPSGKTNHQAMIEAMEAIAKAEGTLKNVGSA